MTISDFISGKFQTFGINLSEADLLEIEIKGNIKGEEDVNTENMEIVFKAIAFFIPSLLLHPISVKQGDISFSWDIASLKEYYAFLCEEYGIENKLASSITDISNLW